MRAALSVLVASTLALAGCIGTTSESPALGSTATGDHAAADALDLQGTGCKEGGGHSVHPKAYQELPAPWVPADIMDDVGPQVVWSEAVDPFNPQPAKGNTFGNWHSTMICESLTFRGRAIEPFLGYVGERIEKPAFDNSTGHEPDHHYLVTVVAVADDELLEAFHHFGIQAMKAVPSWETLPGGLERIQMDTELNGAYDTVVKWTPWGEMMQHTRIWFQNTGGKELPHGAEGHTPTMRATPISFDFWTNGGTHLVADGQAYFSHTGTEHHGPTGAPPGHTAAVAYVDFDRTFAWGPSYPDYQLDVVWDH